MTPALAPLDAGQFQEIGPPLDRDKPLPASRSDYWLCGTVAALVLLAAVLHHVLLGPPVFPVDDAYIVLHNAQVLHWGHDPSYLGVPALAGATSPVHLALVALLMDAFTPAVALWTALWLAILAYALSLVRLARACRLSSPQTLLLVLVGLSAGQTPHQLLNGLETGLALAAITAMLALVAQIQASEQLSPSSAGHALACLCGLLPYIRPDLLPLSLVLLLWLACRHRRAAPSWRAALHPLLTDGGLALLCAAPWAIWCGYTLGTPYPNSVEAKRLFFAQDEWPAAVKVSLARQGLTHFVGDIGLLCVFTLNLTRTAAGRLSLLFVAVLLAAYVWEFPAALSFYEARYLYPLLPLLLYAAADALRPGASVHLRPWRQSLATLLLVFCLLQSCWRAPDFWAQHLSYCRFTRQNLSGVAAWCNHHLPSGSTLLIHDAGYIAYATWFRLVDLVGLKTPASIAAHQALTHPSAGRLRGVATARIARASHAQYLIVLNDWEQDFGLASGLRAQDWRVAPVETEYAYHVYALSPPNK